MFCQVGAGNNCVNQLLSPLRFFYAETDRDPTANGCQLITVKEANVGFERILADINGYGGFFLSDAAGDKKFTNKTRSNILLGVPLAGFKDKDDDKDTQGSLFKLFYAGLDCKAFQRDLQGQFQRYTGVNPCVGKPDDFFFEGIEGKLLDRFKIRGLPAKAIGTILGAGGIRSGYIGADPKVPTADGVMEVRFWSLAFQSVEFDRVVSSDLYYSILSIVVVFFYIAFHTRSFFLSSLYMFQIVMSLPVGYFVYYNIVRIQFYSQVNILAIYLALGIGADSVFVMVDCWCQSKLDRNIKTTQGRLNFALDRTTKACFNTTLTTVASFLSTSLTDVMPIHCFAVFAAVVLLVDYVFMIIFAPTVMMLYHVHFSDLGGVCCCCSKNTKGCLSAQDPVVTEDSVALRSKDACYKKCCYSKWPQDAAMVEAHVQHQQSLSEEDQMRWTERFFQTHFSRFIIGFDLQPGKFKPFAYLFIIVGFAYGGFMASHAVQLTPPTAQEEWFPKNHMYTDLIGRLTTNWQGGAESDYMTLALVFGVSTFERNGMKERDIPKFNWYFPKSDRGVPIYDETFDMTKGASQLFFIDTCNEVEKLVCKADACANGKILRTATKPVCVMKDLLNFYKINSGDMSATFVPEALFNPTYMDFIKGTGQWDAYYKKHVDSSMDLTVPMVRAKVLSMFQGKYQQVMGRNKQFDKVYDWAMIEFRSSLTTPLSNSDAHASYDVMEEFVAARRAAAPEGMRSLFQSDTLVPALGWTWMIVEDALVRNLLVGFAICFPVAYVVLIGATGNIIVGTYAIISIAFIVAGVLGAAKLYSGWDLGVAESIAGVIVIGFSVDYTVHLGHLYKDATMFDSKELKTQVIAYTFLLVHTHLFWCVHISLLSFLSCVFSLLCLRHACVWKKIARTRFLWLSVSTR